MEKVHRLGGGGSRVEEFDSGLKVESGHFRKDPGVQWTCGTAQSVVVVVPSLPCSGNGERKLRFCGKRECCCWPGTALSWHYPEPFFLIARFGKARRVL